ncbi:endonuclease/exonuclease/phosphatase family protein [Sulfitobacter aestuarii]|uniref:Endonuclease/exonuclease/phosphatase family protein n=1 Tax=Sulfitobacter aestuarii TaxID=2161676 RepID=A0ABW5U788_9RHOB
MRRALVLALACAILALAALTFLGLWEADTWWVRMTDFPRLHYVIALLVLLVLLILLRPKSRTLGVLCTALAVAALLFNVWKLWPYAITQAGAAESCSQDRRFTVMIANLQASREEAEGLLAAVEHTEPDLFLAMETDPWWDEQLQRLNGQFPHRRQEVTDGYYGIHLLSRLPLSASEVMRPAGTDTPAISTEVALGPDRMIRFIGLHPRPPHPSQSAQARDAQLMWAALEARSSDLPVVLAGDLNSTPWEVVAERLQRVGAFLDPRQVFGYHATYDAHSWWMYWPLDHLFHQREFSSLRMDVLPGFGSDHYPVVVELCHQVSPFEPPELEGADLEIATRAANALER